MAAGGGLLFVTEGDHPTVSVLGADGVAVREITVNGMAIEVTASLRESFIEAYGKSYSAAVLDRLLDAAPVPQQMNAISRIVVARDGALWLGQRTMPGMDERIWLNLTPEGVPIRRVIMPPSAGVMLDADDNRLLFLRADDMDLHYVAVHTIAAGLG